tara:strand:- start:3879 stop:4991 length:1113 start_codon:yes stop_codon:yes gene_type:complete
VFRKSILAIPTAGLLMLSSGSYAEISDDIRWTGFMSAGVTKTDSEVEYMERFANELDYSDARIGLNIAADISSELSVAGQILMAGRERDYNAHADWVFVTYKPAESVSFMLGRIKFPNLLASEYYDVGVAYPWIRPPQELYNLSALGPLMTYEVIAGGSAFITGFVGDYEYQLQPYFGNGQTEFALQRDMYGLAASLNGDNISLKLGYNAGKFDFSAGGHGEDGADPLVEALEDFDKKVKTVVSTGLTYDDGVILVMAELAQMEIDDSPEFDTTSWYATTGYRFGRLMPHLTYASLDQKSGLEQTSITLGINYQITNASVFKLELQRIDPTTRGVALIADGEEVAHPSGLFSHNPDGNVNVVSMAVDLVF